MTAHLAPMLARSGAQAVQTHAFVLHYRAGTEEGRAFVEDVALAFQTLRPFLQRWEKLPRESEAICQQALSEMQQPDFQATLNLLTVWGSPCSIHLPISKPEQDEDSPRGGK